MGYLLVPLLSVAQQGSISGTITDSETGETLIGVNVLVLGTSYGTASDFDGNYRIDGLRSGEYTLKVSYIGYETVLFTGINVRNGANTARDVTLEPASLSLDGEVLVVGERPLLDVEGSASSFAIDQQALEAAPIRNVESAIATQAGIMRDPTG
ncbi:MAG: carboxypeptidase-like regulatory domain-containing protein, partial [Bacteroidetes bacterium]|nr:carboxypeptidase-like regulatory domain-containing protein [Bacteroidota bacterium]